jgi:NAD-dependent dihydropyrimidine dehydrogenase PreA subunit
MCELCTKHGDGLVWYKNGANYSSDLLSDLRRRLFIENFLESTFNNGFDTLGRLEIIYRKKGRLPGAMKAELEGRAQREHYGQVLPIEEIRELVLKADTIVRMPCACRWNTDKREVRCCYGISFGADAWYRGIDMSYFGKLSDEGLESVKAEEAIAQMEQLEDVGAIHTIWTMVTPFIGAICNCTVRDCLAMRTLTSIHVETMARAEYVATVAEDICTGCGACAGRCQFEAIRSRQTSGSVVAQINAVECFGCGLCRCACDAGAISLMRRC